MKKIKMFGSHRSTGTAGGLRKKGGFDQEKCVGQVKSAVTANWMKVMRSPNEMSNGFRTGIVWTIPLSGSSLAVRY